MKLLNLGRGYFTKVDDDDYILLLKYRCRAVTPSTLKDGTKKVYAYSGRVPISHIIKGPPPSGKIWDHADGDSLNDQKSNLREATQSQNVANSWCPKNTSGYRGVVCNHGKWSARIYVNGRTLGLGSFDDIHLAAEAFNRAAIKYYGEFAKLNVIERPNA